jgi:hypothetical protein
LLTDRDKISNLRQQTWPPQAILVFDWLISKQIFYSETAFPNELKFGRKHVWKVSYKECSFNSDPYQPIKNKNGLWRPCLLPDRNQISIFIGDLPYMLSAKFQFIRESVSE